MRTNKRKIIPLLDPEVRQILSDIGLNDPGTHHSTSEFISDEKHIADFSKWLMPLHWDPDPRVLALSKVVYQRLYVEPVLNEIVSTCVGTFEEFEAFLMIEEHGKTSPGLPWTNRWTTKKECFLANREFFKTVYDGYFFGNLEWWDWSPVFKVSDKEEFLPNEKDKVRTFMSVDIVTFMITWCLFQDFHKQFNQVPMWVKLSSVGTTEWYGGFNNIVHLLLRFNKIFASDAKKWDGKTSLALAKLSFDPFLEFIFLLLSANLQEKTRRLFHMLCGTNRVVLRWGLLLLLTDGTRSGWLLTLLLNTLMHVFTTFYVWSAYCLEHNVDYMTFHDVISVIHHGDDRNMSTKLQDFTPQFYHEQAYKLSLDFEINEYFETLDDWHYISKSPVLVYTDGKTHYFSFKLNYKRLETMLFYLKKSGSFDPLSIYYQKLSALKPFCVFNKELWQKLHTFQMALRGLLLSYVSVGRFSDIERESILKTPIMTFEECALMHFPRIGGSARIYQPLLKNPSEIIQSD